MVRDLNALTHADVQTLLAHLRKLKRKQTTQPQTANVRSPDPD